MALPYFGNHAQNILIVQTDVDLELGGNVPLKLTCPLDDEVAMRVFTIGVCSTPRGQWFYIDDHTLP